MGGYWHRRWWARKAEQVLDATGRIVTPGFIDAHTHLDAQVGWDPALTLVFTAGITTVLVGNCGVTFAPVSLSNESKLAEIMEGVGTFPPRRS